METSCSEKTLSATPPSQLRVAAIQMKFAANMDGNLAAIDRLLKLARRKKADVALFPECALTGYGYDFKQLAPRSVLEALGAVGELAATHRIHLLLGAPVFRRRTLYNSLVVYDRQGKVTHCYAKCHLTELDRQYFKPGNAIALFSLAGIVGTALICHERRYPELTRLAVMAGARIVFHPNAGLDSPAVSRAKRDGRDGIPVRAFENAIHYVFANSVGPQGGGKWSAGDSKIVHADGRVLACAGNTEEGVVVAKLDMGQATGAYALRGMRHPRFLSADWKRIIKSVRIQAAREARSFDLPDNKSSSKRLFVDKSYEADRAICVPCKAERRRLKRTRSREFPGAGD